ncbi:probable ATP-dependent RNA helicase DDX55 homolog [Polyergus mexicanus]|uniref:probable ATP-dependent RNA helicase DDX55 homolog n=1 Tax=Polyergus mexicanus TaxID=615972 RepID=UPI0038B61940
MARGIDISEINWVLQYDPPSIASSFVHRCGRTARIGNEGNALLFLLETEDAYVDFVKRNQKVELQQIKTKPNENTIEECLQYVDMGKLAMGFGLLRMPKMPELKRKDVSFFVSPEIDINAIPYANKQRELHRLEKLTEYQNTGVWSTNHRRKQKQTESWSESKKRKLERQEKRSKRKEKKKLKEGLSTTSNKKKRKHIKEEDLEELAKDIALIKKFKKKKISQEEFDAAFGI